MEMNQRWQKSYATNSARLDIREFVLLYLHHDQVISPCDVGEAVVRPNLVHVVGEDGHDEPAGVVARPGPRLVVTGVIHIHDHLQWDLRLRNGCSGLKAAYKYRDAKCAPHSGMAIDWCGYCG